MSKERYSVDEVKDIFSRAWESRVATFNVVEEIVAEIPLDSFNFRGVWYETFAVCNGVKVFFHVRNEVCKMAIELNQPIISTDSCARLLAWAQVHGRKLADENRSERLRADIKYSQSRAKLQGELLPNAEITLLAERYTKELEAGKTEIAEEINARYGLTI